MTELKSTETDSKLTLSTQNNKVTLVFDKTKVEITSYKVDGAKMFSSSLTTDLYRPAQPLLMYQWSWLIVPRHRLYIAIYAVIIYNVITVL